MRQDYVFVVGCPRSGTKLTVNVLEASQATDFRLVPETKYMGQYLHKGEREKLTAYGDLKDDSNVDRLVDAMYTEAFVGTYWSMLRSGHLGFERDDLKKAILDSDRSERGIFEALLWLQPGVSADTIVGEKTPAHIYFVPELLEWFPEARIIHTLRDPRAVLASELNKQAKLVEQKSAVGRFIQRLYVLLHISIIWTRTARLHARYERDYPEQYLLSRFEDLVTNPEKQAQGICQFLAVPYDAGMLMPRQTDSSHYSGGNAKGMNTASLDAWKTSLPSWMKQTISLWTRRHLKAFGYATN